MPSKARVISRRNSEGWDDKIQDLINAGAWEREAQEIGIEDVEEAEHIRRALRNSGRRKEVAVKAFWNKCNGCPTGGSECRYHVRYSIFDLEKARKYRAQQAAVSAKRR